MTRTYAQRRLRQAMKSPGTANRGGASPGTVKSRRINRYPAAELRPLAGGETPAPSVLLSPPALPDEAPALQDGGPSEHSFHFKPVGDTLAQGVHRKFAAADGSRARSVSGTGGKVYYIIIGNNELKDMKLLFIILSLIIDNFLLL